MSIKFPFKKPCVVLIYFFILGVQPAIAQSNPVFEYTVSFPKPQTQTFHVKLQSSGWNQDTILLKLPQWMPGYYQIMNYADNIISLSAKDTNGKALAFNKITRNAWEVITEGKEAFNLEYEIKTNRPFVATSYVDEHHAYIIPGSAFFYADGFLNNAVSVSVVPTADDHSIATGLIPVEGKPFEFTASDFDILYDCPILIGPLTSLPSFEIGGIEHQFIGYKMGEFDHARFMSNLQQVVKTASELIGDIPYDKYTFIGIGPGRGGIEHLNNTTVSFSGDQVDSNEGMNDIMNFLAHEYYHHYNVKRIRPLELGPFDYDNGSRTNLLWVSEGLSVYYEYIIVKRAGLSDEATFLGNLEKNISVVENDSGRFHQSLIQASFYTWRDGPFGTGRGGPDQSISFYQKGPIIGLLLDFEIRDATENEKSLDDVMRFLYWKYYKELKRGFTDAEFQQACETIAGKSLAHIFEYVYTTKELDYNKYLAIAGLKLEEHRVTTESGIRKEYSITRMENLSDRQISVLKSWLGE